jgi:hypothetical protein
LGAFAESAMAVATTQERYREIGEECNKVKLQQDGAGDARLVDGSKTGGAMKVQR